MKKHILSALALILALPAAVAAQESIKDAWKARGQAALKSIERLDKLISGASNKDSAEVKQLRCERIIEASYLLHLNDPGLVEKTEGAPPEQNQVFYLVIEDGEDKVFGLSYVYSIGDRLKGVNIDFIYDGHVIMRNDFPEAVLYNFKDECAIVFFKTQPLKAQAMPAN